MKKRLLDFPARPVIRAGFCLLSLIFSSCQMLQQMASIRQPVLEADIVRLKHLSFEAVDLVLNVNITNPNPIGVTLNGFDYDMRIEGASLLKRHARDRVIVFTEDNALAYDIASRFLIPAYPITIGLFFTLVIGYVYPAIHSKSRRGEASPATKRRSFPIGWTGMLRPCKCPVQCSRTYHW